jgi:hypothetical protein
MPLFRYKRRVSYANAYPYSAHSDGLPRFSGRIIEVGDVFEHPPTIGLGVVPQDFEILHDPRDDGPPKTLAEVASACDILLGWIYVKFVSDPQHIAAARLRQLWEAATMRPDAPPTPFDAATMHRASTVPELVQLVKLLRQWATYLSGSSTAAPSQQKPSQPAGPLFEKHETIEEPPEVGGQADNNADSKAKKHAPFRRTLMSSGWPRKSTGTGKKGCPSLIAPASFARTTRQEPSPCCDSCAASPTCWIDCAAGCPRGHRV